MTHTYKKKKARNGSIFLDKDYDWNIPSSNLLIYGHNITKNTMFNELLQYENENVTNAKKASIYDTGKTAEYGDQLMTLSTCSYYTKDGRFAVVAKKVIN